MFQTPVERLSSVTTTLHQLAREDLTAVSDPALKAAAEAWCAAKERLDAAGAALFGELDARMLVAHDGATSTTAWLRTHGHGDGAKPRVDVARVLHDHAPRTAAALADGPLSYEKAAAIAAAVTPEVAEAFTRDEADLLRIASRSTVAETKQAVGQWRHAALAEVAGDPYEAARARRTLQTWRTRDGLLGFKGYVGPDEAPHLDALLRARANQLWHDDVRAAKKNAGLAADDDNHVPTGLTLARTGPQRLADAFTALVLRGGSPQADAHEHTCLGGPSAHLMLTVPADVVVAAAAERVQATLQVPGIDPTDKAQLEQALAVLPDVHPARRLLEGPVPALDGWDTPPDPTLIALLACDCTLQRVILDAAGLPLDVGREQRHATPAQRRALAIRDGGCAFPGCDRPPGWCDAHHIIPWELLGPTNLANLVLLCRRHHRHMHGRQPWRCRINPDTHHPEFFDPDGNHVPKWPPVNAPATTAEDVAPPPGRPPDDPPPGQPPDEFRRAA